MGLGDLNVCLRLAKHGMVRIPGFWNLVILCMDMMNMHFSHNVKYVKQLEEGHRLNKNHFVCCFHGGKIMNFFGVSDPQGRTKLYDGRHDLVV